MLAGDVECSVCGVKWPLKYSVLVLFNSSRALGEIVTLMNVD